MDPNTVIDSAFTIGASAAQLSLALFGVVQTLKNAPNEIAEIGTYSASGYGVNRTQKN